MKKREEVTIREILAFNERQLKLIEDRNKNVQGDSTIAEISKSVMGIKRNLAEKEKLINRKNRLAERFSKALEEKERKKENVLKLAESKIIEDMKKQVSIFDKSKTAGQRNSKEKTAANRNGNGLKTSQTTPNLKLKTTSGDKNNEVRS